MSIMATAPKNAEAKLTDLDVREVSVVDRPANKRRFLIVKREGGKLAVIRTEERMSRTAIPRAAAEEFGHILLTDDDQDDKVGVLKDEDLADLIGAEDGDAPDEDDAQDDEAEVEPIEKGDVAAVIRIAKASLAKLMAVVNKLKKEKEKGAKPDAGVLSTVRQVAAALTAVVEKLCADSKGKKGKKPTEEQSEDEKTEKASKDALAVCTAAIGALTGAINQLKELEADADVPPPVINALRTVATALAALAGDESTPAEEEMGDDKDKKAPKKPAEEEQQAKMSRPEVFIKRGDNEDDPEVILKVGVKMKRTRLSLFKKAVEMLSAILAELSPSEQDAAKDSKANRDFQQAMLSKLDGVAGEIKGEIGKVAKRVDDLEAGGRPAGSDEDPPEPVKKSKSLWSNVLG